MIPKFLNITSDSAYKGQDNIYAIANIVNVKQGVSLVKENGDITLIARDTDAGWVKKSGAFLNIEDNATLKGDNIISMRWPATPKCWTASLPAK